MQGLVGEDSAQSERLGAKCTVALQDRTWTVGQN